jgi:hypothetical protein
MASVWDKKLVVKPRVPNPQERMKALKDYYINKPLDMVLLEALGAYKNPMPDTPVDGLPLVEHMIIICIDTESDTNNTDRLTEVGINTFKRTDGQVVRSNPGPHGVKTMEQIQFLHFRIVEHAHLISNREGALGALGNRFGHTKFATFEETRTILHHLFNQPIQSDQPELKGCMRPVVLVGHALRHDIENGTKEGLDYDFAANSTIVARIDTQPLARDLKVWVPPAEFRTNDIGLRVLIHEKAGFLHLDDHTASNDAARTMLCAIWMVVPESFKGPNQPRTMQEVANRIEMLSQRDEARSPNPYGSVFCCVKCGGRGHPVEACCATVWCGACSRFDTGPNRDQDVASHIETYCPHVAKFKAWARRYKDAWMKNREKNRPFSAEVLAGPGLDAHPFSTWTKPGRDWPLSHLDEVLHGMAMSTEPTPFVYNLQSALGGLCVPSGGDWVMDLDQAIANGNAASPSVAAGPVPNAFSVAGLSAVLPTSESTPSPATFSALRSPSGVTSASPSAAHTWLPAEVSPAPKVALPIGSLAASASTASAPGTTREVKASESRGRGRGGCGSLGRGASGGRRGNGGAGSGAGASTSSGSDPSWDPSNVW